MLEGHIRFTLLRCSKIHHPPIDPFQALRPTFSGPLPQYKGRRGAGARRRDGQAILSPKVTMWCRPASLRLLSSQVAPHSWETPWPSWLLSRPKSLHQGLTPMFMGLEAPGSQRAKNPVSASALLTGKFLRVRKIFARMVYNVSLKGPILSRPCKSHPDNMDGFKLFI